MTPAEISALLTLVEMVVKNTDVQKFAVTELQALWATVTQALAAHPDAASLAKAFAAKLPPETAA